MVTKTLEPLISKTQSLTLANTHFKSSYLMLVMEIKLLMTINITKPNIFLSSQNIVDPAPLQ